MRELASEYRLPCTLARTAQTMAMLSNAQQWTHVVSHFGVTAAVKAYGGAIPGATAAMDSCGGAFNELVTASHCNTLTGAFEGLLWVRGLVD